MASRYRLVHHPAAAADYRKAMQFFAEVDGGLAELFKEDFKKVLRGLESGKMAGALYAKGHPLRWIKLRRFSHKVFFEPWEEDVRFVLAVVSGRRHPAYIRRTLSRRRKGQ